MLKEEFEKRVGKTVDYSTYEVYNAMYNATDLDKDAFCAMLDKDKIPESESAKQAREERARLQAEAKQRIATYKDNIEYYKRQIAIYQEYIKELRQDIAREKLIFEV